MKRRQAQAGLTLIEMMIAVVISMVLSIAVMVVMSTFEGRRRTLGSASDLDQAGSLAMYQMDRWIRSAGTGLVQGNAYTYGCELFASQAGTQILPIPSTPLPAPFASVTGIVRLAPVMILPSQNTPAISGKPSDMLVVMSAGNDASQIPQPSTAVAAAANLTVANTTEFAPNDLVLIGDKQPDVTTGGSASCMVSQVAGTLPNPTTGIGKSLPLAGNYYAATVGARSVASYTQDSFALDIGGDGSSTATSASPSFQLIGVGDNNVLYSYDLLRTSSALAQPQAEGVFEMHALYGIDSTGASNNVIDQWVDPSAAASAYTVAALTAGTPAASILIKSIRAVHVALILRTALPEKDVINTATGLTYFVNVPGMTQVTRPLAALPSTERNYRYRVVEATIPVRNNNY